MNAMHLNVYMWCTINPTNVNLTLVVAHQKYTNMLSHSLKSLKFKEYANNAVKEGHIPCIGWSTCSFVLLDIIKSTLKWSCTISEAQPGFIYTMSLYFSLSRDTLSSNSSSSSTLSPVSRPLLSICCTGRLTLPLDSLSLFRKKENGCHTRRPPWLNENTPLTTELTQEVTRAFTAEGNTEWLGKDITWWPKMLSFSLYLKSK